MGTGKNRVRRVRGPYAKKACVHCRKAKAKCDNGRPCRRCIKHGIGHQCVDPVPVERKRKRRRKKNKLSGTQIQNYKVGTNDKREHVYPSLKEFLPFVPMSPKHQKQPFRNIPPPPTDYNSFPRKPRNIYNNINNNPQFYPPPNVNPPSQNEFERRKNYYQQYYSNPPPVSQDSYGQFPEEPDFLLEDKRTPTKEIQPPPPPPTQNSESKQVAPYYQKNRRNNNFPVNTYGMDGNYKSYTPMALTGRGDGSGHENTSKQIVMMNPTRNQYYRAPEQPSEHHQYIQEPPDNDELGIFDIGEWDINLDNIIEEMDGEVPMITNPTATTSPFQNPDETTNPNMIETVPPPITNEREGNENPANPMIAPPSPDIPPDIPLITMGGEEYQVGDNYRLGVDDFLGLEELNLGNNDENNNSRSRSRREDSPSMYGMSPNGNDSVGNFEDLSPLGMDYLDGDTNNLDMNEMGELPSPTLLGRNSFDGNDEYGLN